jgi:hypothetical protein
VRYDIPPITFAGTIYIHMELTDSAGKHFRQNAERYFRYVVSYLDGQTWKPIEFGQDGSPEFMTASCTTSIKGTNAQSDYRETWFRVYASTQTIQFFHGSSIRKEQYMKSAHQMQLQMMEPEGG